MSSQSFPPGTDSLREYSLASWLRGSVKPEIDRRLADVLAPRPYADHLRYTIEAGGKRWRPGLAILIGRLCGVPEHDLLDLAAGIELLHTFTLVHDDIVDGDEYRRGLPAMWAAYDEPTAINIGDMMFAQAISLFPEPAREPALETAIRLAEGQQLDLDFCQRRDVAIPEYMEMARKKTGGLLELCITAPQVVAGRSLGLAGFAALGPAYQIRDDLLDFYPEKGRVAVGNDVRAGKRTLMVVHADDGRVYDVLDQPFDETAPGDVEWVRSVLTDHGSMAYARATIQELTRTATDSIHALPPSDERSMLEDFGALIAAPK